MQSTHVLALPVNISKIHESELSNSAKVNDSLEISASSLRWLRSNAIAACCVFLPVSLIVLSVLGICHLFFAASGGPNPVLIEKSQWCSFGSLPGTWTPSSSLPGSKWHIFNENCRLQNLLSNYSSSPANRTGVKEQRNLYGWPASSDYSRVASDATPAAKIVFIGDSVDRHILTYLCTHVGGRVQAAVVKTVMEDGSDPCESTPDGSEPAAQHTHRRKRNVSTTSINSAAPLSTNGSWPGCIINTCSSPSGQLHLLGTYIPGVHPTGPYHKGRRLGYKQRIDQAATVWKTYSSGPPDIVMVSSLLWDVARLYAHEPQQVAGEQLALAVIESWIQNYTEAVSYAKKVFPEAGLYAQRTTMQPRYDTSSGIMEKTYLGKAVFVRQLNAAGRHAAGTLGLEILDFEAIANRFQEGQRYLQDLIHPGLEVGLEMANMLLNYVEQLKEEARRGHSH
ncbi:hypothetical protein CEUSTIGMA_g12649.t1 [Chlamydomonas eustigma]|uniref:Uncharacterized protein n=1 Tax=Chlamydomonas eustigma TaxID=1157962 RepID=A0A250XQJ6_9CHLO|nr:hypothetical protein CEUSTIGMA_g12649.t1 [Chlamydomonas eustigma]|eukprot:GAX85229.1 hypothetical protein CEUSTIGMA_g12649.t1 [Chlamydomonas eustigma]